MMMQPGYLQRLTIRLASGLGRLEAAVRERHARYLLGQQRVDGGWAGRMGESDLYYTSFALRALAILGELQGGTAERAAAFLTSRLGSDNSPGDNSPGDNSPGDNSLIDQMSLVYGAALLDAAAGVDAYGASGQAWKARCAARILDLRREDGGFAKGEEGIASSTYYTFLSLICLELLEHPLPDPGKAVAFIQSQHHPEGGFLEIRVGKRPGTNPTAAAIGALQMLHALDDNTRHLTSEFLADMQEDEGGLLANLRIPIPDLLSTFTGLVTLADLDRLEAINTTAALRFAQQLESPAGGFRAAAWDETCDAEYTFYGLGCLALLS